MLIARGSSPVIFALRVSKCSGNSANGLAPSFPDHARVDARVREWPAQLCKEGQTPMCTFRRRRHHRQSRFAGGLRNRRGRRWRKGIRQGCARGTAAQVDRHCRRRSDPARVGSRQFCATAVAGADHLCGFIGAAPPLQCSHAGAHAENDAALGPGAVDAGTPGGTPLHPTWLQ